MIDSFRVWVNSIFHDSSDGNIFNIIRELVYIQVFNIIREYVVKGNINVVGVLMCRNVNVS